MWSCHGSAVTAARTRSTSEGLRGQGLTGQDPSLPDLVRGQGVVRPACSTVPSCTKAMQVAQLPASHEYGRRRSARRAVSSTVSPGAIGHLVPLAPQDAGRWPRVWPLPEVGGRGGGSAFGGHEPLDEDGLGFDPEPEEGLFDQFHERAGAAHVEIGIEVAVDEVRGWPPRRGTRCPGRSAGAPRTGPGAPSRSACSGPVEDDRSGHGWRRGVAPTDRSRPGRSWRWRSPA